jgi:phosphohistidine phosphatase
MQENRLLPDTTVTSSAGRAVGSAEKALKAGGQSAREIVTDARLYQGGQAAHHDVISAHSGPGPLLIVSHPEALSELTASLCPEAADVPFSDGTAVWLALTAQDTAELRSVIQPESLPKGFPFPGPGSDERRKRPPYYYTQSAVIPYRRTPDLEILIISSSKGTHWVLPKGIHEPGLTAQQSAAEEAFEEAGIRGRVHASPVGIWRLHKWGGTCTVATYAMEVTEVLEDAAW